MVDVIIIQIKSQSGIIVELSHTQNHVCVVHLAALGEKKNNLQSDLKNQHF